MSTGRWTAVSVTAAVTAGLLAAAPSASAAPGADLTDNGGTITAQYEGGSAAENYSRLIDNDVSTKYFTGWVQYRSATPAVVDATTYTDTGLTAGTTYHYRVRAAGAGEAVSAWSNTARTATATSADPIDITDLAGTVADKNNITGDEGRDKVVDSSAR